MLLLRLSLVVGLLAVVGYLITLGRRARPGKTAAISLAGATGFFFFQALEESLLAFTPRNTMNQLVLLGKISSVVLASIAGMIEVAANKRASTETDTSPG